MFVVYGLLAVLVAGAALGISILWGVADFDDLDTIARREAAARDDS